MGERLMIRVPCPKCGSLFDTDDKYAGKMATCLNSKCRTRFPIPDGSLKGTTEDENSDSSESPPQGYSGVSIAGFICGIVAIVLPFIPCMGLLAGLTALAGIICSIIGLVQAKKKNRKRGLAIAGLTCSIFAIIWIPLLILVIFGGAATLGTFLSPPSGF
jgi:hypothetical protein